MPRRDTTSGVFKGTDPVSDLKSKIKSLGDEIQRTMKSSTRSGRLVGNQFQNIASFIAEAEDATKRQVQHQNALERVFGRINNSLQKMEQSLEGVSKTRFFGEGTTEVQRLSSYLEKARIASSKMEFEQAGRSLHGMVSHAWGLHRVTSAIQASGFSEDYQRFSQQRHELLEEIQVLQNSINEGTLSDEEKEKHETLISFLKERLEISESLTSEQLAFRAGVVLTLEPLRRAAELQRDIQLQLRMTNVGHAESLRLSQRALDAQISSLALLDQTQAVGIMEQLTRRARQFTEDGSDAARTAGMLAAGLDMSATASATLLWRMRALGIEDWDDAFKSAADQIAWFAKNTNLTVQEIENLVEAAQPLMYAIPHRLRHHLIPEIMGIGAAFKEIGLDAQNFVGQLRDMTGLLEQQGVIRAALTTAGGDIDFMDIIRGQESQVQITQDLATQIRSMFGEMDLGITGAQIASQRFGISLDEAIRILDLSTEEFEEWKSTMRGAAELGEARRALEQQIEGPMQALRSIGNSLQIMLVRGGSDVMRFIRPLSLMLEWVSKGVNWVMESDVALRALTGSIQVLGVLLLSKGIPTLTRLWGSVTGTIRNVSLLALNMDTLTASLYRSAMAASTASAAHTGAAGAQMAGAAAGAGRMGRGLGGISRIFGAGRMAGRMAGALTTAVIPVVGQLVSIGFILWTVYDLLKMSFGPVTDFLGGIWNSTLGMLGIMRETQQEEARTQRQDMVERALENVEKGERQRAEREMSHLSIARSIGESGDEVSQAVAHLIEDNEIRRQKEAELRKKQEKYAPGSPEYRSLENRIEEIGFIPELAAQLTSQLDKPGLGDESHVPTARALLGDTIIGATGRAILDDLSERGWSDDAETRGAHLRESMEKLESLMDSNVHAEKERYDSFQGLLDNFRQTEVQQFREAERERRGVFGRMFGARLENPLEGAERERREAEARLQKDPSTETLEDVRVALRNELSILQAMMRDTWDDPASVRGQLHRRKHGWSDVFGEGYTGLEDARARDLLEALERIEQSIPENERIRKEVLEDGFRSIQPNIGIDSLEGSLRESFKEIQPNIDMDSLEGSLQRFTQETPEDSPPRTFDPLGFESLFEFFRGGRGTDQTFPEESPRKPGSEIENLRENPQESWKEIDIEVNRSLLEETLKKSLETSFEEAAVVMERVAYHLDSGVHARIPEEYPDYPRGVEESRDSRSYERDRLIHELVKEVKKSLNDNPLMRERRPHEGVAAAAEALSKY